MSQFLDQADAAKFFAAACAGDAQNLERDVDAARAASGPDLSVAADAEKAREPVARDRFVANRVQMHNARRAQSPGAESIRVPVILGYLALRRLGNRPRGFAGNILRG